MRRRVYHRGFNGERPFVYPIVIILSPGRPEGLCAELHNINNRMEGWEALCASFSLIISFLEPRTSSPLHRQTTG